MKKIFFAFTTIALIAVSCAKVTEISNEQNTEDPQVSTYSLRATVNQESTKVQADNAGIFSWQAGDVISVLDNTNTPNEYTTTTGGVDVNFSGSIAPDELGAYAFYPANDNHNNTVFALGPEIDWKANASNMPMVGPIVSETASFKTVGAVIKLVCFNVDDNARVLQVTSLSSKLAGTFAFDSSPMSINTENTGDASLKTLTINFSASDIAACNKNMVFYIPVPCGNLGKLTFAIKTAADGTTLFSQQTAQAIEVSRNQVVIPPVLNCSTDGPLMWSEKFTGYNSKSWTSEEDIQTAAPTYEAYAYNDAGITYTSKDGGSTTKTYNEKSTSGAAPELLISKTNGTFTVKSIPTSGAKKLFVSFLANHDYITISSNSTNVTIGSITSADDKYKAIINNPDALTSINLEFKNTYGSNVRVDNFEVRVVESYTAPSITPASTSLTIAVAEGDKNSASTTFTFTNPVDELPLSAIASDDWIQTSISGSDPYTLTVTADKKTSAGSRVGSVILRATGVSKTISITQPSALVSNPGVLVTPGDGTFTAIWTKDENATGYVVYLGDPSDESNNVTSDVSFSSGTYTLTKDVANGDYDLYVGISGVTTNYVAESGYTHESFTCSSASPTYGITINQPATGGSISVKGQSASAEAEEGEEVALVATPADGYKLASWSVTKKVGGAAITVTSNSFVMPAESVIVTATFAAKEWNLVTSVSSLSAGDIIAFGAYAITHKISGTNYTKYMVAGAYNSNKYDGVDATFNNDGTKITTFPATGKQFVLGGNSTDGWTFKDGNKYINIGSGSGKAAQSDDPVTWSITITDGIARIQRTESLTTYTWYFNPTAIAAGRFCPYTSSQKDMRIYRFE